MIQKIRIFASRAASNSLAVQVNRVSHRQTDCAICSICGVDDENIYHALVICPKARALLFAMRDVWNIPEEKIFKFSVPDWLLVLLDQLNSHVREQVLFIFWRAWHLRNDLIFHEGREYVCSAALFLESYWASYTSCHSNKQSDLSKKGKRVVDVQETVDISARNRGTWQPPSSEVFKINVDASFVESMSAASVGVIARDHMGQVILSSWDFIGSCTCVDEAEIRACLAGLYVGISLINPLL